MGKKGWVMDLVIGLLLSLFVAACYLLPPVLPFIEALELKSFDMRSTWRQTAEPSREIVLVSIDDSALAQVGRWPWPRWRIAALVDKLSGAGSKVIGLNILLSEEEQNEGLKEIQRLQSQYEAFVASRNIVERGVAFSAEFSSAAVRLDTDSRLLASIQGAGNVVLPMFFDLGGLAKPEPLPAAVSSSVVTYAVVQGSQESEIPDGSKATYPIVRLAEAAAGVGHVNVYSDIDGSVRREIPVVKYGESYYPSYALRLIMAYMGLPTTDAVFTPGVRLQAGKLEVPLDSSNGMLVSFVGPVGTFQSYSYREVMKEDFPTDTFKGKIVIVGLTAAGVGTLYVTPAAPALPSIELTANVIENILNRRFLTRPPWAARAELGLLGLVALFLMVVYPRLKALWGNLLALVLLICIPTGGFFLFQQGLWLKVTYPVTLLFCGCLVSLARRLIGTEKGKELVEASAIEQARMLGLSFQGQGMLDMAFDKFRQCPVDDNLKDALYNLALDFERKRQYAKAVSVMEHIAVTDPAYKDIPEKMKLLKAASEGAVFGGVGQSKKEGTVLITGGATKPTLGRYEIEKELGRGAMGVVYLGRDPKINRMVAIKTMMMEEGTDAAAAKEIKERFFREAESAGTLNHPNIIRIFDAGEESDVCYIAMELLEGNDLTQFTAKDKLLPPVQTMEYVALVADALDFAHAQGIVHRDIKPANIMLLKDGTIRVADFGIARITASSKTATGTIMGTPSYMSPEQVAGKKVDGRSDLFSLTVALYEFLTGEKPFKGGEGIGTLLFQIANDPHPDPVTIRGDLPPGIKPIIDKGLAKNPDQRYARGSLMAADLRALIAAIKSGKPTGPADPASGRAPPAPAVQAPQAVPPLPPPEAPLTQVVETPPSAPIKIPAFVGEDSSSGLAHLLAAASAAPARSPSEVTDPGIPLAPARERKAAEIPSLEPPVEAAPTPEPVVEAPAPEPALEPAPAVEPAPEPGAPAYSAAEEETIVMAPGSIPVISPELMNAPAPEPAPAVEPAPEAPPTVEMPPVCEPAGEGEFKIALEPRATLKPASKPETAPTALPGPVPPPPSAGEQPSSDSEFKIVLEPRASVKPAAEKLPGPRALAGPVPSPPSAGEQPSSDSEFKIVLEPRATIKSEPEAGPPAPSSDKTVVLPPGWKPPGTPAEEKPA